MSKRPDTEQQLLENIRQTLDNTTGSFDGRTQAKLALVRAKALEEKARSRWRFPAWQTGAVLATAMLLLVLAVQQQDDTKIVSVTESFDGFDVITDQADLEFYRELEFYDWLSREENHAG